MLVIIGIFWVMAALVFVFSQWIAPLFLVSSPSPTSGFNYAKAFGGVIKPFGLWVAGALLVLGPVAALYQAAMRGADSVAAKALGTGGRKRR